VNYGEVTQNTRIGHVIYQSSSSTEPNRTEPLVLVSPSKRRVFVALIEADTFYSSCRDFTQISFLVGVFGKRLHFRFRLGWRSKKSKTMLEHEEEEEEENAKREEETDDEIVVSTSGIEVISSSSPSYSGAVSAVCFPKMTSCDNNSISFPCVSNSLRYFAS
jgi:hypothetical protein